MPTARPRYTVTDTGRLAELLDAAERRWPDVADRKALLLRLAEAGHGALTEADRRVDELERHQRLATALQRIPSLVDRELLLAHCAWT